VHELGFLTRRSSEPDLCAPCLKIFEIAYRRDLEVPLKGRCPGFDIVGLGRRERQLAGAQETDSIRYLERVQDGGGIGARIEEDDEQLRLGGGYDHNWVINGQAGTKRLAARAYEPTTGRVLEVHTTEPGMQFYCGNFLPKSMPGKGGQTYVWRGGFCLETQHYPDSPNQPNFPSTALKPGETYSTTTVFKFLTQL